MAADVAPGLLRAEAEAKPGAAPAFGFLHWNGHDAALWAALLLEARERRGAGIKRLAAARPGVAIRGSDRDQRAVKVARDFVKRAGLHGLVTIDHAQLETVEPPAERGLLATNAPYGERLDVADTEAVYRQLGERLREAFPRWSAVVLAGDQRQLKAIGLAPKRETDLRNGPLECMLGYYAPDAAPTGAAAPRTARAEVRSSSRKTAPAEATEAVVETPASGPAQPEPPAPAGPRRALGGGAEYLANRLRKNQRRLAKRLQREGITCYRLYDADLPEYNLVVDVYGEWAHVQEYAAPPEIDRDKAKRRLDEARRGHRRRPRDAGRSAWCSRSAAASGERRSTNAARSEASSCPSAKTSSPTWSTSAPIWTPASSSTSGSRAGWSAVSPAAAASSTSSPTPAP